MTSAERIERSFGRAAASYPANAEVQEAMAAWLAQWAPQDRHRRGRALELGAGTGLFTEKILPWTEGSYLATDLSAAMCAAGRARLSQIEWRRARAEHPPEGPWDWIFTSSMLQWSEDPAETLAACARVLAPRTGRLLAGLYVAPTVPELTALLPGGGPLLWRTPAQWLDAARRASLSLLRSESVHRSFEFPGARAFLRSLHAAGAAPERKLSAPALRRLLAAYERQHVAPRGARSTWTFFRFEASNAPS